MLKTAFPRVRQMPLFSIVTVVRNDEAGLRLTHGSIAAQTCRDFEWLIVDGASDDGTVEAARSFDDPYIDLNSEPDHGIYDAMNKGLDRATGDYVLFLNAGDTIARHTTLESVARRLRDRPIDFLYGDSYEAFGSERPIYKTARGHARITYGMFGCHQAMYYRRTLIDSLRFDPDFWIAGDYCFTAQLFDKRPRVERVDDALCVFDRTGVSVSHRRLGRRENWRIQRDVLGVSLIRRCGVQAAYVGTALLADFLPSFYKLLRFRRSPGS
jgi:putative colanic acid biosynthesis glycosyltransferase